MTERSYDVMRRAMSEQLPRDAPVNEQHKFAIEWLYQRHDEVLERLAKLERKTSSTEGVLLQTVGEAGDLPIPGVYQTVMRVVWVDPETEATVPLCADGSRRHDCKGQPSCPACGWTPKLAETCVFDPMPDPAAVVRRVMGPVYAGDGHPALRAAYEPEDHEPEPEGEA